MTRDILALDVGTSALKLGVFGPDLAKRCETQRVYEPHLYDRGKADIDPEVWWRALRECCAEKQESLRDVGVVALSVTTPGLTPMAADGTALSPAVLFLDGRSRAQSAAIRRIVGEERFLAETCNLPVSGGSSLSSILWFRDERPTVWAAAAKFGHCNTYLVKRLTGRWAIDPSTVSISGLYNTARNDLTWNDTVLRLAGIPEDKLPPLFQSYDPVGEILPAVADELGLPRDCTVLCGGNDAVLAALSGGLTEPGDINLISGTCDIASVCTDAPVASPDFNVRCHAIPGRWLTFFVLNTGGAALDWFHASFCRELTNGQFYDEYVPGVLTAFLEDPGADQREAVLPAYEPYLGGSRYSLEPLHGRVHRPDARDHARRSPAESHSRQRDLSRCAPQGRRAARELARHGRDLRWRSQGARDARRAAPLDGRVRVRLPGPVLVARGSHARPDPSVGTDTGSQSGHS